MRADGRGRCAGTALSSFRRSRGIRLRPLYGTTETGGIAVAPADAVPPPLGCVGPPMSGVEVDRPCPTAAARWAKAWAAFFVRSSSMMAGYLADGAVGYLDAQDGWFETGDVGLLDAAGELHLKGRVTEVINVLGMKVIPSEVEEVIASLPGVAEVKVYPGRHRSGSQFVKAAVVLRGGLELADLRAHCEQNLVYYKRPEQVRLVESLPRTPSGKIILDQLP